MPTIPPDIIAAARASQAKWKIPASISLAQWALESAWGKSVSGKNNYGGITAKVSGASFPHVPGTPLEPATLCWTREVVNGQSVRCQRYFKDYASAEDYFDAHGKLLATGKPYAKARALLPDPNAFADALTGVYATDPKYGSTLKAIMRGSNLYQHNLPLA
ncbi:glycoside hydrolase family 73 protein [Novosphingobium humi]|uniref:Glucosaminidase domain-containing protein n=1 Tax=Novosphingobium humi TaxID=2282397 RepID=A0ABY7U0C2_9SPHN|nr:glucosaminidase domain-containing protein [Novosphingobium humi]WCT78683.1 glucosaminidase domain-containing protein [Novosphingobium humi]